MQTQTKTNKQMESYQNPKDVVIDIPDEKDEEDEEEDDDKCCSCIANMLAPPMYASLCVCGQVRCCEASNQDQHVCVVRLRFLCFWLGCMCAIMLPMLFGLLV